MFLRPLGATQLHICHEPTLALQHIARGCASAGHVLWRVGHFLWQVHTLNLKPATLMNLPRKTRCCSHNAAGVRTEPWQCCQKPSTIDHDQQNTMPGAKGDKHTNGHCAAEHPVHLDSCSIPTYDICVCEGAFQAGSCVFARAYILVCLSSSTLNHGTRSCPQRLPRPRWSVYSCVRVSIDSRCSKVPTFRISASPPTQTVDLDGPQMEVWRSNLE